jgi:superfamily II DNA or RNA helicase/HKD family nuclease
MDLKSVLYKSVETGFIDKSIDSNKIYRPELITNDKEKGKKVLSTILSELERCDEFWFSVAFITSSGVIVLQNTLEELERKGIKGKVLASQYLNFTHPEALKKLLSFGNIELKIATKTDFHSKGYLFEKDGISNLIIGSSNWTQTALSVNKEWNLKVSATKDSELIQSVRGEFQKVFDNAIPVDKDYIDWYSKIYLTKKELDLKLNQDYLIGNKSDIKPNNMQIEALRNIESLRRSGKTKALLISATGTGKTFLSAFDVRSFKPKKFLFVVHRQTIAKEAKATFERLLDVSISMGLYSGKDKEKEVDFVFATIQTISKQEHLEQFRRDHFDYIVIDETHRAGADSYRKVMSYFQPKFLLGMTATPERTDGEDIFGMFDHNIAYEIRLHRALEEKMLAPFHYFGVSDILVNGEALSELSDFKLLTTKERVNRVIEKANFYSCDSGKVRGLIFCSRQEECQILSESFNLNGFRTVALTGSSTPEQREDAIIRLESDNEKVKLDYIFTVDIFNEGIDIPKVNQIIMLRPTQSAIIFVQQLGRGLRLNSEKDYLTVIDFIGNYANNYMVPMALYGDSSYNKDTLRKLMVSGSSLMPGASTINFDEIAKERIFNSIDNAKLNGMADFNRDYDLLKFKLGRIPMMMDYIVAGARDPRLYEEKFKSYYKFVIRKEKDFVDTLDLRSHILLEYLSLEINNTKRILESYILWNLIKDTEIDMDVILNSFLENYGFIPTTDEVLSAIHNLNLRYVTTRKNSKEITVGEMYNFKVVKIVKNVASLDVDLKSNLKNLSFKKFLIDSVLTAINKFDSFYKESDFYNGFVLHQKYSRKDVFRILNWDKKPVDQNVGGYLVNKDKKVCPIFVTYNKKKEISSSINFKDEFIDQYFLKWQSKSPRRISSPDVQAIVSGQLRLPLFIQKNNKEGIEFYYMGDVKVDRTKVVQSTMTKDDGQVLAVVDFVLEMQIPVSDEMFEYLTRY